MVKNLDRGEGIMNIDFREFPLIETDRLRLREVTSQDLQQLYKLLANPKVAEYDYFYPVETEDEAMDFIKRYERERLVGEEMTWGIALKDTDQLIGTCCLGDFELSAKRAEVGYAILEEEWCKGYGSEAVEAICTYGFKTIGLNRIEAMITPENEGSVKLLAKLGFLNEGLVRQRDYIKGELVDSVIMGKLKEEHK